MTIKSYVVNEGTLTLGTVGTLIDATAQVEEVAIEWDENVADSRPTLSGEELAGKATYTAKVSGTVIQDLTAGGLVEFTWTNKGMIVPFRLVPANVLERAIVGQLRVAPLKAGGKVLDEPSSDFEWGCIGQPVLEDDLA